MSRLELRARAADVAVRYVGVEETSRNSGPEIDRWLALVGLSPGNAWCYAAVYGWYQEAADELGMPNPLPKTGRVVRAWQRCPLQYRSTRSARGAVFIHLAEPTNPDSDGHCGIVLGADDSDLLTFEGNTNVKGAREGKRAMFSRRPRPYVHGLIDIGLEGPQAP